ncbi:MAG TPA: cupin domain-containing protein [Stellaceae bacterium]|nr:cupin domain-containing protein [Stellaceae bacterium]
MAEQTMRGVRRVVTEEDAAGRARIVADGQPAVITVPERPGYNVSNVWVTGDTPAPIAAADAVAAHKGVLPPPRGTVLRVIDYPPEASDPAERRRQLAATFGTLYPDAEHRIDDKHPGMHRTETVDYAIVLEGEIVAMLDDSETVLRAGDILIQRGTNHAWANRSGKPARICFVLIDGRRSS